MWQLTCADQIRMRKVIHEWLPTQVSPGNNPTKEIDHLCPTCHCHEETPVHFLQCNSPTRHSSTQKLWEQLTTFCTKHALDPHSWYQLWWFRLTKPDAQIPWLFTPSFRTKLNSVGCNYTTANSPNNGATISSNTNQTLTPPKSSPKPSASYGTMSSIYGPPETLTIMNPQTTSLQTWNWNCMAWWRLDCTIEL